MKKPTSNWARIINFKQLQHSRTLPPSFKFTYISLEQAYKAPVKKDLTKIISFRNNQHLKFYNILSILHIVIFFIIYQTVYSFLNKRDKAFKNRPSKICGRQPLKKLKWYGLLKGCLPQNLLAPFLNTCPKCKSYPPNLTSVFWMIVKMITFHVLSLMCILIFYV